MKRFIHFGCWNNSGCDYNNLNKPISSKDTALTRVMKGMKQYINTNSDLKPEFITVAGDNYYPSQIKDPQTKEKTKVLDEEDLTSGFKCLPEKIKKYIILGNHDLDIVSNRSGTNCQILDMQKEMERKDDTFIMDDLKDNMIMHTELTPETIVIMIDTSMYMDDPKSIKKVISCYNHLFQLNGKPIPKDIEEIRDLQRNRLENYIKYLIKRKENIKNIIVIGHHPMVCFKSKVDNEIQIHNTKNLTLGLINELYYDVIFSNLKASNKYKNINYYYLCADLHQYQFGDIELTGPKGLLSIQQYISGTGGSQLEEIAVDLSLLEAKDYNSTFGNLKINYNNVTNIPSFGFLDCVLDEEQNLKMHFEMANMEDFNKKVFKGGYIQYQKHKLNKSKLNKSKLRKQTKKYTKKQSKVKRKSRKTKKLNKRK